MRIRCCLLLVLCLFSTARAWGDLVVCLDGRQFEGEIIEENDKTVRIKTAAGILTLARADIKTIEHKDSPVQIVARKRADLASDNAKARWELVDYCLQNKLHRDAEQLLNEILSMASPYYAKATGKLAELLAPKDPKRAVELLDALAERTNDAEARIKSREIKRQLDEKRRKTYEEALQAVQARNLLDAIETLRYAYQLSYPGEPAAGAKVSQEEVLAKLAEVRGMVEQVARGRAAPAGAPGTETPPKETKPEEILCSHCPNSSGWRTCYECAGKGKVERIVPEQFTAAGVIPARKVTVVCPVCGGGNMARCPDCQGSGLDLNKLDSKTRPVIKSVADASWGRPNDEPARAMKDLGGKVVFDKLKLPDGFKPPYPTTQKLRALLESVPVAPDWEKSPAYQNFKNEWRKLPRQDRAQFLCCYADEVAGNALPAAGAAGGDEAKIEDPGEAAKLDLEKIRQTAPTVSATMLSALPEDFAGQWVWVGADYKGPDATLSGRDRVAFEIATSLPHNLHPFAFVEAAKPIHAAAGKEKNAPPFLATLVAKYPYEAIGKRAESLKDKDYLQMFGRVLYRKDRNPETSLEVWDFSIDVKPEIAGLLEMVRKPVTFHFEDTPLTEAAQLLSLLTGTKIRVDVPKEAQMNVNARVTKQNLASALNDLLKEAKLNWVFDEKEPGVKIVPEPKPEELEKREDVTRHLK
ncbi:MAG: hypothetical protein KIS92_14550 [Planctomycetota bacterium]|nr:hypothetical protein [Planctomycetota bacterium]